MKTFRLFAALSAAVVVSACGEKNEPQNIAAPTAGSAVKFFNFGVGAPAVNFYANDLKLSGITSTACSSSVNGTTTDPTCLTTGKESTTGTTYGNAANGSGLYSSVAPGSYTLSGKITATTDNGRAISSTPATLENGKFYSYYLSGFYNTAAKSVEAFVVEDPLPAREYDKAYVRFINAISNSQPMTLYAKLQTSGVETAVGGNVAYKAAGAFVSLPAGTYDLNTRVSGSSTNVITRTDQSFSAGRVYTITARGDITVTSSTATNRPILDNTPNR
jgi:hypothetical protein